MQDGQVRWLPAIRATDVEAPKHLFRSLQAELNLLENVCVRTCQRLCVRHRITGHTSFAGQQAVAHCTISFGQAFYDLLLLDATKRQNSQLFKA